MSGRGHRKLRLCSRKNYERKKRKKLSTPLSACSFLTVSIPFQLLPAQPLTLSLPITLFHDTPFSTFESLQARVECAGVISQDWRKEWNSTSLSLFQLNSEEAELSVTFCVAVMKDLTYTVSFRGMLVDPQRGGILSNFPSCIHSVSTLKLILESVARSYICIGNADDRFVSLPTIRHGVLKDHSRANIVAMIDSKRTGRPSVYHVACEILVPSTRESRRCSCCSSYRNVLRAIVFRSSKDDRTHPSSHTNYTALNSPEKNKRLHRLHVEAKNARQKLERLRETLRSFIELTKMLFTIPGVTVFLSEKLSQDPLEKFFGCQRQRGGTSDDPTVAEFVKNTNALRVIDTVCGNVSRGNCRGNKESFDREKENTPLPKRRRYHK